MTLPDLCADCGHHIHRAAPGHKGKAAACAWHDCTCPAPSLASTLRVVVEARKAAAPGPWDGLLVQGPYQDAFAYILRSGISAADGRLITAAANWVESHGEAAAAALERAQAVEDWEAFRLTREYRGRPSPSHLPEHVLPRGSRRRPPRSHRSVP